MRHEAPTGRAELDVDADGHPPDADCATLDPMTHCDGWPGDFQIDPTQEVL